MNFATVIVGLIIALIIIWCFAGIVRSRKKGKCTCGCENCNGCIQKAENSQRRKIKWDK